MAPVITVQDLRKVYDDVAVVDGVSFSVERGECVGILGPNGAGKTTTLEMVEGIRRPDGGTVDVLGRSPWPRDPRLLRLIGVQLQGTAFIEHLSAIEQLRTVTDLYGVDRARAEEVLALVSLTDMADKDVDDLSGGQRQRLSIACALVHRPQVLFLDEPSTGLDPAARRQLWEVLGAVRAEATTVVLTTHYMEEAEELCDRVAVMERGRILAMDSPAELVRQLDAPTRLLLPPEALGADAAASLDGVLAVEADRGALTLVTREPAQVIARLSELDALVGLQVRSGSLEDVFVSLTGRRLVADEGATT
ncbi:MAG: ABC transporter ATP-binding protein [Microthrixaceae bacterium]